MRGAGHAKTIVSHRSSDDNFAADVVDQLQPDASYEAPEGFAVSRLGFRAQSFRVWVSELWVQHPDIHTFLQGFRVSGPRPVANGHSDSAASSASISSSSSSKASSSRL